MDWAGNQTNINFVYVLDYSSKTNPPAVQLYWPTNGAQISGTNFTWRGAVDDPTVTISAQITDTNGDTNVVHGIVERNGNFWVENLPLAAGLTALTLTATDVLGQTNSTTIAIVQSSVGLSITWIDWITSQTAITVEGSIDTAGCNVWVNGVQAWQSGSGTNIYWEADNVPVNGTGTAVIEALAISTNDSGIPGTGGGGTNSTLQNPGNPTPSALSPVAQADQDKLPAIIFTEYRQTSSTTNNIELMRTDGGTCLCWTWSENWWLGFGGSNFTLSWDSARQDFGWGCQVWNTSGYGTLTNGDANIFGDYTTNLENGFGLIQSDLFVFPWYAAYVQFGYLTWGPGMGVTADYESSMTTPDSLTNYDYGAVTDHCVTLMGYVLNGKAVPVQYLVGFDVNAIG